MTMASTFSSFKASFASFLFLAATDDCSRMSSSSSSLCVFQPWCSNTAASISGGCVVTGAGRCRRRCCCRTTTTTTTRMKQRQQNQLASQQRMQAQILRMFPSCLVFSTLFHDGWALSSSPRPVSDDASPATPTTTNNNNNNDAILDSSSSSSSSSYSYYTELHDIDRVFCLSDLHTDHMENLMWLQNKMNHHQPKSTTSSTTTAEATTTTTKTDLLLPPLNERDLIIVAGDISHRIDTFVQTIQILRCGGSSSDDDDDDDDDSNKKKNNGCQVFFVPGNHEAWIEGDQSKKDASLSSSSTKGRGGRGNSLDKLQRIQQICHENGVYTGPLRIVAPVGPTTTTTDEEEEEPSSSSSQQQQQQQQRGSMERSLWIIPMECWYDGTLSISEQLCQDFAKWPWMDFRKCSWPIHQFPPGSWKGKEGAEEGAGGDDNNSSINEEENGKINYRIPQGLVEYFLQQNEIRLQQTLQAIEDESSSLMSSNTDGDTTTMIMTVSHFLPNRQCLPDWKDLEATTFDLDHWLDHGGGGTSAKFAKVAGSQLLDDQVRSMFMKKYILSLSSSSSLDYRHMHIFGHSHRPKDFNWRGIRYVHNPLGKPRERNLQMISPNVTFQLLWSADQGPVSNVGGKPILRYWEEYGGGKEALWQRLDNLRSKL